MATTTATLTLSSADLTGDTLSLSTTATLTKAGSGTGLEETTGVSRKTFNSAVLISAPHVLVDASDYTTPIAAKVYIKNLSTTNAEYVSVYTNGKPYGWTEGEDLETMVLGRMYAGDWAFLPWDGANDIIITTSSANMTVEYMVIYETLTV